MCRKYNTGECAAGTKIRPLPIIMRVALSLLLFLSFNVALFGQESSVKPLVQPGGLTVVPPYIDYESVVSRIDIPELLAVLPDPRPELQGDVRFDLNVWAKDIRLTRDVWCLQFSFKPVRLIDVDIPNAEGNFDKKKIWYLVYCVKNLGPAEVTNGKVVKVNSSLTSVVPEGNEMQLPVPKNDDIAPSSSALRQQSGIFVPQPGSDVPIRFTPHFVLATHRLVLGTVPVTDPETEAVEWKTETTAVAYNDRVIPLALSAIMRREGFNGIPETTVSIAQKEIAPGQELWGVAMWADVDPRINEFSIFISGLSNAYQWGDRVDEDETYVNTGKIGEGRILKRRVLKTVWWRVGDANSLNESQIHFGPKDANIRESLFVAETTNRRMSAEERRKFDEKLEDAVKIGAASTDGGDHVIRITPAESALYHLIRQDWLKPSFGYEWLFL